MMRNSLFLSLLALSIFSARAENLWRIDAVPYYAYVFYDDTSVKDNGHLAGTYLYMGYGLNHLLEAEYDYTYLDFDGSASLTQHDLSATYNNFSKKNWKFRFGGHYMTGDDAPTDGAWLAWAGAHYFVPSNWDLGIDFYYSDYSDFTPSMNVFQVTPHYGFNFLKSLKTMFRSDTTYYHIQLSDEVGLGRKSFHSLDERITLYAYPWTFSIGGWIGKQTFAARNGGFTVYNLSEEHTGGVSGDIRFVFNETTKSAITFRVTKEEFNDFGSGSEAGSTMFQVLYGFSF